MNQLSNKKIRVFFDSTIFDLQIFGGVSRYFTELIGTAQQLKLFIPLFKLTISNNEYAKASGLTQIKSNLHYVKIKGFKRLNWKVNQFVNSFYSNRHLRKGDFDIYHPTYYSKKSVAQANKYKTIVTVYDMIHEIYPDLFSDSSEIIEIKKQLIFKSAAIIAISENTKRDIIKFYPEINPNKIFVTYLASSIAKYPVNKINITLDRFLIFVGNRDGYKNFTPMLEAILPSFQQHRNLNMICVGGGTFKAEESAFFEQENLSERIIQKNLTDSELKWCYMQSVALIFPSEYEGFGIPVIEAFECECPVILPNLSSFPEIGGDAALFYENFELKKINFYINELMSGNDYKRRVIEKGKIQAAKFSWIKMAQETQKVYKSVISDQDNI